MSMTLDRESANVRRRVSMMGIGALAGLAAWVLIEVLPDHVANERLLLFVSASAGGFFAALLATLGPLPVPRAALAAALASVPAAALLTWASLRYSEVGPFLETGHAPGAFGLIVALSLPFLVCALRSDVRWNDYAALFSEAWDIVARVSAAVVFVAVFWGVVFLSDALFGLVGLRIIETLLDIDPVPPVMTGLVAGLALAVMAELGEHVSPTLILRLLRLLLPVFLAVTAVFLLALPVRGISGLFGGLSAAGVLLAMGVGIATLIAAALESHDAEAARSPVLRGSAQLLALALPVLAGLATFAVYLRVDQYGWSPDRLAAACASLVALGYGGLYSLAVLRRAGWMQRIRQANLMMALAVIAVSALWLSPLLVPERLSARDQVDRFAAGRIPLEALDLWFLGRETGIYGDAALARLAALDHPQAAEVEERIRELETSGTRYDLERVLEADNAAALRQALVAFLPVRPDDGTPLRPEDLAAVVPSQLAEWLKACEAGPDPGCVAYRGDMVPSAPGAEILVFWNSPSGIRVMAVQDGIVRAPVWTRGRLTRPLPPDTIPRILGGGAALGPPSLRALDLGEVELLLLP